MIEVIAKDGSKALFCGIASVEIKVRQRAKAELVAQRLSVHAIGNGKPAAEMDAVKSLRFCPWIGVEDSRVLRAATCGNDVLVPSTTG